MVKKQVSAIQPIEHYDSRDSHIFVLCQEERGVTPMMISEIKKSKKKKVRATRCANHALKQENLH